MRRLGLILATAILGLGLGGPASASNASAGLITHIIVNDNGVVLFTHSGTRTTPPTCSGPTVGARWAFDGSTGAGHAKLSALLSAYALGKQIWIVGTGSCAAWGDTESVGFFEIQD
ncbi:MAG TPA: hypothetical protein VNZ85_16200 [Caulobacter sp.]|nr:hypothetical protein [Caulobacter sp.]